MTWLDCKCNDPGSVAEVKRLCVCLCFQKSIVEDEGERRKVTVPKDVNKCRLLFGYPEVFVDNKTVAKMLGISEASASDSHR